MKKPRFSLGSIVMLLATLFVVIGMAAFLTLIAGDGVYERTRAVFGLLADQTEEATAAPTGVPTASPMPEITEGPTPRPSPTATPALEPKRLTIAAAGTIYAPKTVRESVQEGTDHYDFMTTFEGLSGALENADLSIVTLETLAAGREKGYGNYNTTPQILDALHCRRILCRGDGTRAG
ncbi:MAG: CapA family protein [Christensenellales bacterium]